MCIYDKKIEENYLSSIEIPSKMFNEMEEALTIFSHSNGLK